MKSKLQSFGMGMLCLFFCSSSHAQISINSFGNSGAYSQNFNSLDSSTATSPWTNDSTLNAWYCNVSYYTGNSGTIATGGLYSFGNDADRALGSIASSSLDLIQYGVRIKNNTGSDVDRVYLRFTGEQWRHGNSAAGLQSMRIAYAVADSFTGLPGSTNEWSPLQFWSPQYGQSGTSLDGNLASNQMIVAGAMAVDLSDGKELFILWSDTNNSGFDHALAIDDILIAFYSGVSDLPVIGSIGKYYSDTEMILPADLLIDSLCFLDSNGVLGVGSHQLTLSGDIYGEGTYKSNKSSKLKMTGNGFSNPFYSNHDYADSTNRFAGLEVNFNLAGDTFELGNELQVSGVVAAVSGEIVTRGSLLLVAEDETTYGQITGNGNITGFVSMEMLVPGNSPGWRNICVPFDTVTAGQLGNEVILATSNGSTIGGIAYQQNLFSWSENSATWNVFSSASTSLYGKGMNMYLYNPDNTRIKLAGLYQNSSLNLGTLSKTGSVSNVSGWHLVPNPFPSGINWDSLSKPASLSGSYSLWSTADGGYRSWNGTVGDAGSFIPPMHAFWVYASSTLSSDFIISSSSRTTEKQNHFGKNEGERNCIELEVKAPYGTYRDQVILYQDNSTHPLKSSITEKRFGLDEAPNIWFVQEQVNAGILPVPDSLLPGDYPLGFYSSISGKFRVASTMLNWDPLYEAWLIDKKNQLRHRLDSGDFTFTYTNGEAKTDRFVLRIEKSITTSLSKPDVPEVYLYSANGNLYLISGYSNYHYKLFGISGKLMAEGRSESKETIMKGIEPGIYFIEWSTATQSGTIKCVHHPY
ncbi:MAG: hypothetical protein GC180_09175 [Bacteroidetes bacterium]|nr:hypothetical protein [Bacteroidota bacterium]